MPTQARKPVSNIVHLAPHRHGTASARGENRGKLTAAQWKWLSRGLRQPGGKLPLFDRDGQKVSDRTIRSCVRQGYAEPWFENPIKPDWLVCKLTDKGRDALAEAGE